MDGIHTRSTQEEMINVYVLNSVGNHEIEGKLGNIILFVPVVLILILTERNVMATTGGIVFRTVLMAGAFGQAVILLVSLKVDKFLD
jgi:hypothetical protein